VFSKSTKEAPTLDIWTKQEVPLFEKRIITIKNRLSSAKVEKSRPIGTENNCLVNNPVTYNFPKSKLKTQLNTPNALSPKIKTNLNTMKIMSLCEG